MQRPVTSSQISSHTVSNTLHERIQAKGLSVHRFAESLGVTSEQVWRVIYHETKPSIQFALQCALLLECTVDELFQLTPDGQMVPFRTSRVRYYWDHLNETTISHIEQKQRLATLAPNTFIWLDTKELLTDEEYKIRKNQFFVTNAHQGEVECDRLFSQYARPICEAVYVPLQLNS